MFGSERFTFARSRKFWLSAGSVGLCVVLLLGAWHLWSSRKSETAAGLYLVSGGSGFLEIEALSVGRLNVKDGFVETHIRRPSAVGDDLQESFSASMSGDVLTVTQSYDMDFEFDLSGVVESTFVLRPSETVNGDWDLVDARILARYSKDSMKAYSEGPASQLYSGLLGDKFPPEDGKWVDGILREDAEPLLSFLHRVDDTRVGDYMATRLKRVAEKEDLERIREITDKSDDAYLALHRVEMEARFGDLASSVQMLEEWEAKHEKSGDPLLLDSGDVVRSIVERCLFRRDHPGVELVGEMFPTEGPKKSGKEVREWLGRVIKSGRLMPAASIEELVVGKSMEDSAGAVGPFLGIQTQSEVITIESILDLFRGERERALEGLGAIYLMGQSMCAEGSRMSGLIGLAVCEISMGGFERMLLNGCEAVQDFDELWVMLERLGNVPEMEDGTTIQRGEWGEGGIWSFLEDSVNAFEAWNRDPAPRFHSVTVRFQLLRMAFVGQRLKVLKGRFPSADADFAQYFPDGLPTDPFDPAAKLRYCKRDGDFYVYSVGADKKDNGAGIEYNWGVDSEEPGDILVCIPGERDVIIPRDGVRADDAEDLLRQFPRGLPLDPFNYGGSFGEDMHTLSLVDATSTQPLRMFSFGPGGQSGLWYPRLWADASSTVSLLTGPVTCVYRYESGFSTSLRDARDLARDMLVGDDLLRAQERFVGDDLGKDTFVEEEPSLLGVLFGGSKSSARDRRWPCMWGKLEPRYDPSNGTLSKGNIFVTIPKRTR